MTKTLTIAQIEQLTGEAAPANAVAYKYADPIEDERWLTDESEAIEIAKIDPLLVIWIDK